MNASRDFAEKLIAQEQRITPERLDEHRRRLVQKIAIAQTRERRMRIALSIAVLLVLGLLAAHEAASMMAPHGVHPLQWLFGPVTEGPGLLAALVLWVVFAAAVSFVALFAPLYWLWYGRRPRQAREEYILLMLSELQGEVDDLKRFLEDRREQ